MKIGIMTFWWSDDNYGQLLQCYALQKYLRDAGHDAYLIRYDSRSDYIQPKFISKILKAINPGEFIQFIIRRNNARKAIGESKNNPRYFDNFREKNINQSEIIYNSYEELKENPPNADIYIVGSDQVWSFILSPINSYKNIGNAFLLNFGKENVKRIAFAASWGTDKISEEYINLITPLLKIFDHVSVREKTGIELCNKCGYNNAVCIPDPVFLLEPQIYFEDLVGNDNKTEEKYIVLYMLNNTFNFDINKIFDWARTKGMSVKFITGNGLINKNEKIFATIPEWLNLIKNAEYVITNSYHCSVFSILANKHFGVIPLNGHYEGLNYRLVSLFELCGIESRFITNYDFSILNKSYIYDAKKIRTQAQAFIKGFIDEIN